MSCEQLNIKLEDLYESLPADDENRRTLARLLFTLGEHCPSPSRREQVTHTSRLVNSEKHARLDGVWQEYKERAEALLEEITIEH